MTGRHTDARSLLLAACGPAARQGPAPTWRRGAALARSLTHSLLLTDLSARAKSPFWPQRFTSLHSAAAAAAPAPPAAAAAAILEPGGETPHGGAGAAPEAEGPCAPAATSRRAGRGPALLLFPQTHTTPPARHPPKKRVGEGGRVPGGVRRPR